MAPVLPENAVEHFTHPNHPLLELFDDKEYICDGCKTNGSGKRYRCDPCDFDLHERCAKCPMKLSCFMHPQHELDLVVRTPKTTRQNKRYCSICEDEVEGLFYRCKPCDFDVHPLCTLFPQNVRHAIDKAHTLTLQPSSPSRCLVCMNLCNSWRYRCGACRVDIHLECVLASPKPQCNEASKRPVPQQPPPRRQPLQPPPELVGYAYGGRTQLFSPLESLLYYPSLHYDNNQGEASVIVAAHGNNRRKQTYIVVGNLGVGVLTSTVFGSEFF